MPRDSQPASATRTNGVLQIASLPLRMTSVGKVYHPGSCVPSDRPEVGWRFHDQTAGRRITAKKELFDAPSTHRLTRRITATGEVAEWSKATLC